MPRVNNELDCDNIAEEIKGLGRSDLRTAQSLVERIVEHLLKLEFSGLAEPAAHWCDEIVEWRLQLEKTMTWSIEAKLDLAARYGAALCPVRRLERDVPGLMGRMPPDGPYSLEQIVSAGGEDWFPPPHPRGA